MTRALSVAALLFVFVAGSLSAADRVVLKGGAVIDLKSPPVQRGNNVILTKTDGTVLSVPISEIDRAATAAMRSASASPAPAPTPAPAATLAGAARASKEVPKARVRITDADVSHGEAAQQNEGPAGEAEAAPDASAGAGRVEVADYTQEKSGDALVVRGTLRNPGATPAINVRMSITAIDSKGQTITSAEAGVSNGTIEPSRTVAFSASIPVGARTVGSLRFSPRWVSPALPAPASQAAEGGSPARDRAAAADSTAPAPTAAPKANTPPPPPPTPYGRGSLYAAPPANAPSQAPPDGKTGYLPGASNPANQPKPPN